MWQNILQIFIKGLDATPPPKGHNIFKVTEQLATHFKKTYESSDHAFCCCYLFCQDSIYIYIINRTTVM